MKQEREGSKIEIESRRNETEMFDSTNWYIFEWWLFLARKEKCMGKPAQGDWNLDYIYIYTHTIFLFNSFVY